MIPTRGQIKTRFNAILDDPNSAVFTEAVFAEAFGEGYDVLFNAALNVQCPRIRNSVPYNLPANTTSLTPATAGISDFADYEEIEERLAGSSDKYVALEARDQLSQRDQGNSLGEFVWRFDTFYFIGANTSRQLRLTYESSGTAPTDPDTSINWDGVLPFLANYSVGVGGQRKGYDEVAARCMKFAVGSRFDEGVIGGELYRILQPRVRSMQHVQIAAKPYTVSRMTSRRRVPYIVAQQPAGGATAPAQFSYSGGTITGTLDGTNGTFLLSYPVSSAVVILDGATLTPTRHYTFSANQIVFLAPYIPQPGADILVEGWL